MEEEEDKFYKQLEDTQSQVLVYQMGGFLKGKSCLTKLISSNNKVICLEGEEKDVAIVSENFSEVF